MTTMFKIESVWTGFPGANGYTNLYFETSDPLQDGLDSAVQNVKDLWEDLKGLFPPDVTITVTPTVELIEDIDGELVGFMAATSPPAATTGTLSGTYAAPVGGCINWLTESIQAGRRVRGRTFLVPFGGGAFQADGSLNNTFATAIGAAAESFRTATGPTFGVWARPRTTPSLAGKFCAATSSRVPDKAVVLRSRRD